MGFWELWDAKEPAYGMGFKTPNLLGIEAAGRMGFDWIFFDLEHGAVDASDLLPVMMAATAGGVEIITRVRWNDPGLIMRVLDTGGAGVIVPMVNNADDARAAAGACRYGAEGYRSWGHMRPHIFPGFTPDVGNRRVVCAIMIETVEAVDNIDEILAVPGIDAAFIGRFDMAVSAGLDPDVARNHPDQLKRVEQILDACKRHDVAPIANVGSDAASWRERGVRLMSVTDDRSLLAGAKQLLTAAKA